MLDQLDKLALQLLEAGPEALIVVDANGLICLVNGQAEKLFIYTREELLGQPIEKLLPERSASAHVHMRTEYVDTPKLRPMGEGFDLVASRKDGTEFSVEVSLSPIETNDGLLVASAIRDVSARKRSEQELKDKKAQADGATLTKSRFLAAANHDLRQPLQSVGLYLSAMRRVMQDSAPALEIAEKIQNSLDVMSGLLDSLLDVSKFDTGAVDVKLGRVSLQHLFDLLLADAQPQAVDKNLTLVIQPTALSVFSDPGLLLRVLENFLFNAIRYTHAGEVRLLAQSVGDQVRIDVVDTGIGIPEQAQQTIFDEYFQVDNPMRERSKGLGLGLSIVKHIAQLLGHKIEVASQVDLGSRFSVWLPKVATSLDPAGLSIDLQVGPVESLDNLLALIIDDDPAVLDSLRVLLELSGMSVYVATDRPSAMLSIAEGLRPHVVISDFRLPGVDGNALITEIRAALGVAVAAILITGDTAIDNSMNALLPDVEVIHKPVNGEWLLSTITDLLITIEANEC